MPRDGTGTYTLPASNPVAPFTTIATSWANPTLSDIASALTDSLSRSGQGGMLAPFKIADGTLGAPGLGFINEPGIGLYRESAGLAHLVNSGVKVLTLKPGEVQVPGFLTTFDDIRMHAVGSLSVIIENFGGNLFFSPSTAINGDIPNTAIGSGMRTDGTWEFYDIEITGVGKGIKFPDGSIQTSAAGVKSIQRGQSTITTNLLDVLITAVNPAKTMINWLGSRASPSADVTSAIQSAPATIYLLDPTHIRIERLVGTQVTNGIVSWEVVEFF